MKRYLPSVILLACILLITVSAAWPDEIISAGALGTPVKGSWSATTTWSTGVVPTAADNVTINAGDTVYIDVNAEVSGITVGTSDTTHLTALIFASTGPAKVKVNGSILIYEGGAFRTTGSSTGSQNIDTIWISGSFTNKGVVDFRTGSAPQVSVAYLIFIGSGNSNLKSTGAYNSTLNEFNGITIDKTGAGKITLQSDIYLAGGSSADLTTTSFLDLRHGLIYTGNFCLIVRSTAGSTQVPPSISNYSAQSYIVGCLGRGMSSGSLTTREFPVGDAKGYRSVKVHNATVGGATGHNLRVRAVLGNANPSNSTPTGGVDKISTVRYYKLTYDKSNDAGTYGFMAFDKYNIAYGPGDGITEGNSNLRIAHTTDSLINWRGLGQVRYIDTTVFADPPSYWKADSLPAGTWDTLQSMGKSAFIAFANASGTHDNTLGVADYKETLPHLYKLSQNYPNPFNPTTNIEYTIGQKGKVVLDIYNILGQAVARLVDEVEPAGSYKVEYDASGLSSGVYLYRVTSGSMVMTKTMLLIK